MQYISQIIINFIITHKIVVIQYTNCFIYCQKYKEIFFSQNLHSRMLMILSVYLCVFNLFMNFVMIFYFILSLQESA